MAIVHDMIIWVPVLLKGFVVSLQLAFLSLAFGLPLGLLLGLGSDSKKWFARSAAIVFVECGRGAPVLILLYFLYFGLPHIEISLSSFISAVLALAWSTAAYTSEIFRAAFNSVPAGQREAGFVVGLTKRELFQFIILPQGIRVALPPLLGFCLLVFQATSLAFTIAVPEMMSMANRLGSQTFQYMAVYALTVIIYASVCAPATLLVTRMEKRMAKR